MNLSSMVRGKSQAGAFALPTILAVCIGGCAPTPPQPNINENSLNDNIANNDNVESNDNVEPECFGEGDCAVGMNCDGISCVATEMPDLVIGDESPFVQISERGTMIVRRGFQGGNHIFVSVVTSGFEFTDIDGRQDVLFARGIYIDGAPIPLVVESTNTQFLQDTGNGYGLLDRVFVFIDGVLPPDYDGREATVEITVTDANDPSITSSIIQRVTLRAEQ